MHSRTVLVLGGGIGGVVAARRLRRRLPASDQVLLVERDSSHRFQPSLPFVLAGSRNPAAVEKPISGINKHGVETMTAEVTSIDVDHQVVEAGGESISYDRLVISLGTELDPSAMPGFEASAVDFFTLEGAIEARDRLRAFEAGKVAVVVSKLPYKCPAAPYEAAFIADALLRRRGLGSKISVEIYTPEPLPMPTTGPAVGHALASMLAARDIGFHSGCELAQIDPDGQKLEFADGSDSDFDLLLGVPPHSAPAPVRSSILAGPTGYVPVDRSTLETQIPGVYVIGDSASIALTGGKFLPKAGIFAHAEAEVVAARIAADLAGKPAEATFDGTGSCFVELGFGRSGYAKGSFYDEAGPVVRMRREGYHWHLAKLAFEQYWLRRWW